MPKSGFSEELMKVAVEYWVNQLRGDAPPTDGDEYARDRLALSNPPALGLIERVQSRLKPNEEQLKVFAEKLREFLIEPYPDGTDPRERPYGCITPRWIQLRTDYQAQGLLALAAKAAGISDMAFPFKTVLLIKHGCIIERDGFGKKIFEGPAPEGPFGID